MSACAEAPFGLWREGVEGDEVVLLQLRDAGRRAARREIGGARDQHAAHLREREMVQRAVGEIADPHGDVDALLSQRLDPVRRADLHREPGMALQEARHDR